MFIVHVGWNGPDGPGYTMGGVYSTKDKAMAAAKKLAELSTCDPSTDTVEETDDGYVVTVEEMMGVREGSTDYVQVTEMDLDDESAAVSGEC